MKRHTPILFLVFALPILSLAQGRPALRVFVRGGVKTHGPGQHEHALFLADATRLLNDRGAVCTGSMQFPTEAELARTDVLVIYAADGMKITGDRRRYFEGFLRRGGGLVVIHDGVVSGEEHEWAKRVQGGAWIWKNHRTKWFEGKVGIYFVDHKDPITRGISNFDWKDEIYYDLDMAPGAHVLATSFHSVFVIAPQIWTYERTWEGGRAPYRVFVSIPGHNYDVFKTPHYRAILLRGLAWAGKRTRVDEFCSQSELASLRYPEGGPTAPEKAGEKLNVHPEFNINLVASEPLIQKVISLDWAPDGKLWVAETPEYPNGRTINHNDDVIYPDRALHPERYHGDREDRPARDRISWLEDTDGDGVMDRKHVFFTGLERVTSLVFHRDGVIVAQAPDILWIRDRDGDGRAETRVTLYTGFGTFDAHAVINNFRWGLDGWVYGAIGYSAGRPRSGLTGKDFGRVTAGVIRFKPDGSALEQVSSGSCNTWGFDFAPDGEMFFTTATCGQHFLHVVMPERFLARANVGGVRAFWVVPDHQEVKPAIHHTRPPYVQIDWVGQFTAAAGCCLYNGGAWPARFNGSHFCSEPTVNIVHHEFLRPSGVTYVASKEAGREETEFIAGRDLWFRPIHTRVGPDGALYVVDFYNQAVIHNDTRGPKHGAHNAATRPDRDHHFGRIWRVQHRRAKVLHSPNLAKTGPGGWVQALRNENGWVRDTAARLLRENGAGQQIQSLVNLVEDRGAASPSRIAALYTLEATGHLGGDVLEAAIQDPDSVVRKNALRVAYDRDNSDLTPDLGLVEARINDEDPRVRLNALLALSTCHVTPGIADVVLASWPGYQDPYLQSAALGVAVNQPELFLAEALSQPTPAAYDGFLSPLSRLVAERGDPDLAAAFVEGIARGTAATDRLKAAVLQSLGSHLGKTAAPDWSEGLRAAFVALLRARDPRVNGAALPLIARWDAANSLAEEVKPAIGRIERRLGDTGLEEDQRAQAARSLLGVRRYDPAAITSVAALLGPGNPESLKQKVVAALGDVSETMAGQALVKAFPDLSATLQKSAFGQIIKRPEWSLRLLAAIRQGTLPLASLGTVALHRLKTHSDRTVAERAVAVIEAIRGPEQKAKDLLISRFAEAVEQPGDIEKGERIFTDNCANCHRFKGKGRDLAPDLTGMGAHGRRDLLVHILDPNRLVEPNFISVSIETKDDQVFDGIVERENRSTLFLRNASGDYEIPQKNVAGRRSTGLSVMPTGFEALGAEGLRDLLSYLEAGETKYRVLNLQSAYTVSTDTGNYRRREALNDGVKFKRFGILRVGKIPFEVLAPNKSENGNNLIVLKGGRGFSKTLPQRVEIAADVVAAKLDFLGGVGGWAWPWGGDQNKDLPVLRAIVHYRDGDRETLVMKNGIEFADWNGRHEVPGSTWVPDVLHRGQLRWFSKSLKHRARISKIVLESFNNTVAPTIAAITAERANPNPAPGTSGIGAAETRTIRTLIVGGGSSHDFERWFHRADATTLRDTGLADVRYTEDVGRVAAALADLDVLYLSNNQPMRSAAVRKGLFEFINSGHGLLLVHPSTWYNWNDWPAFNRVLVGGGTRGHDRYGEFVVTVAEPDHPVMKGVPESFRISDELYHFQKDTQGSPIEVLARGTSPKTGDSYPVVWITRHDPARIVCITLGHDGKAHGHPAYQTLLKNSLRWVSRRPQL